MTAAEREGAGRSEGNAGHEVARQPGDAGHEVALQLPAQLGVTVVPLQLPAQLGVTNEVARVDSRWRCPIRLQRRQWVWRMWHRSAALREWATRLHSAVAVTRGGAVRWARCWHRARGVYSLCAVLAARCSASMTAGSSMVVSTCSRSRASRKASMLPRRR